MTRQDKAELRRVLRELRRFSAMPDEKMEQVTGGKREKTNVI